MSQKTTELAQLLRTAGFKATTGRIALLALLDKSLKPLSIKDMQAKMKSQELDQATIYRIVHALKNRGVIRQVDFQHSHAHYELSIHGHHHHLICRGCGKVVDLSDCNLKSLEKQILKVSKFANVTGHSLEFFGTCPSCFKKAK